MNIYLAGPLFTLAEREFNNTLARELEDILKKNNVSCKLILPQKQAEIISGRPDFVTSMYKYCLEIIDFSDMVIAILDGSDADSGTCVELGYAQAQGKFIIGLRTDLRPSEYKGLNLMVSNSCDELIYIPEPMIKIEKIVEKIVNVILKRFQR